MKKNIIFLLSIFILFNSSNLKANAIDAQNDSAAFRYLYSLKVNNPSNYSLPRIWRAGISIQL